MKPFPQCVCVFVRITTEGHVDVMVYATACCHVDVHWLCCYQGAAILKGVAYAAT